MLSSKEFGEGLIPIYCSHAKDLIKAGANLLSKPLPGKTLSDIIGWLYGGGGGS